jgi:Flp pilus assembly protein TadD
MLAARGDVESAISHYRRALEIKPEYAKAHHNLGLALKSAGEQEAARRHLREARRLEAPRSGGSGRR